MNIRELKQQMKACIIAGNAMKIISSPGMAKSDTSVAMASWFLDYVKASDPTATVGFATCSIATASPMTANGLPWKAVHKYKNPVTGEEVEYTATDPAIPQWFMAVDLETGEVRPADTFTKVYLVMEEWGQGSAETKRAFSDILLTGGSGQYRMPQGSVRIALSNEDARDGVTKEFDHVNNRVAIFKVTGDVDVWIDDFAIKPYPWQGRMWQVMPESIVWAKYNANILYEPKPKEQGPWCTQRSFTAQDRYVQAMAELNGGKVPLDDPNFIAGCAAHCGMAQTQSYVNTLRYRLTLPSYEDVVKDPNGTAVPNKADQQMLMAYELSSRAKPEHVGEVLTYMSKRDAKDHGMPKDMIITFVRSLLQRDAKHFLGEPAMTAFISKNAYLIGIIGSIK